MRETEGIEPTAKNEGWGVAFLESLPYVRNYAYPGLKIIPMLFV
jgi:hypothetical protein